MASAFTMAGETYPVVVKSSEYFQLKKKLDKGINEIIIRTVNGKLSKCRVVDTSNNQRVLVNVLEEL